MGAGKIIVGIAGGVLSAITLAIGGSMLVKPSREAISDWMAKNYSPVHQSVVTELDSLKNGNTGGDIVVESYKNIYGVGISIDGVHKDWMLSDGSNTISEVEYSRVLNEENYITASSLGAYVNYKIVSDVYEELNKNHSVKVADYVINDAEAFAPDIEIKLLDTEGNEVDKTKNYGDSTITDITLKDVVYELYTSEEIEAKGGYEGDTLDGIVKTITLTFQTTLSEQVVLPEI